MVEADGSLVVRAPLRFPDSKIEKFILEHADWIRARQELAHRRMADNPPKKYLPGELFWYLGERYPLQIVPRASLPLQLEQHFVLDRHYQPQARQIFEAWYRRQARQVLYERSAFYASQLGLRFNRLRLSSARTRWGSCSNQGTLSFAWRLVMAPLEVIDYIVVHELTHLKIPNHSNLFWAQVSSVMPGYRQQTAWLKQHGHQLSL